jgi:hypothetical protein
VQPTGVRGARRQGLPVNGAGLWVVGTQSAAGAGALRRRGVGYGCAVWGTAAGISMREVAQRARSYSTGFWCVLGRLELLLLRLSEAYSGRVTAVTIAVGVPRRGGTTWCHSNGALIVPRRLPERVRYFAVGSCSPAVIVCHFHSASSPGFEVP